MSCPFVKPLPGKNEVHSMHGGRLEVHNEFRGSHRNSGAVGLMLVEIGLGDSSLSIRKTMLFTHGSTLKLQGRYNMRR